MKSLYESILSSTRSGKAFNPLENLKMKSYTGVVGSVNYEKIADDFIKFYGLSKKESIEAIRTEIVHAINKADTQLRLDMCKYQLDVVFDKNAYKELNKALERGQIKVDKEPPVFPCVAGTDDPLIVRIDHKMWGQLYFTWYWGHTSDLFGHGANSWLEITKKD